MWRFGDVEVDPGRRELRRGGSTVHLEPQALDVLIYLIERRDRVVSKVELLDGVWGHRFVSEANLTTRVKEARRAVGDDGTRQHTIRNARGRGYRFVADVDLIDESANPAAVSDLVGRDGDLTVLRRALGRPRLVTITGPWRRRQVDPRASRCRRQGTARCRRGPRRRTCGTGCR